MTPVANVVIRTDPDDTRYLVWSSIIDQPTVAGDRATIARFLEEHMHYRGYEVQDVFERADANGSSDRTSQFAWWTDDGLIPAGVCTDRGIRRHRLGDYTAAVLRGDKQAAEALTEPFDDDTP